MRERKQDLFEIILEPEIDAVCITTNGNYSRQGLAIMGGGCARVAAEKWQQLPINLGKCLKTHGNNIPYIIGATNELGDYIELDHQMIVNKEYKCLIFSFPTINSLNDGGASLDLIKRSAVLMMDYANSYKLKGVVCARFGSGIGGLNWYDEVFPVVKDILDDRFIVVCQEQDELRN